MSQEPSRRPSFIGLSVCLAIALLPAWTVLNNARNLDKSTEVQIRTGVHRALRAEGLCLMEEPSGLECSGLSFAAGTLADTVFVPGGGRGLFPTVVRVSPPGEEEDHLVVEASIIDAPWVVCHGTFEAATGDAEYRCSTDRLAERAALLRYLVLPVVVLSLVLASHVFARWRTSGLARGLGSAVAAGALVLFVASGGPQLSPQFPDYGRSLGDSVWSRGMLLK